MIDTLLERENAALCTRIFKGQCMSIGQSLWSYLLRKFCDMFKISIGGIVRTSSSERQR